MTTSHDYLLPLTTTALPPPLSPTHRRLPHLLNLCRNHSLSMPPRKRGKAAAKAAVVTSPPASASPTPTTTTASTKAATSAAPSSTATGSSATRGRGRGRPTRKKSKPSDPAEETQASSTTAGLADENGTTTTDTQSPKPTSGTKKGAASSKPAGAAAKTKKKQTQKDSESASTSANGTKPKAGAPRGKRGPVKPQYDEVWKHVYLAGTEWDQMQQIYSIDWDFDHLDAALLSGDLVTDDDGSSDSSKANVYLFGATEPQLVPMREGDDKGEVVPIPTIIAVVSAAAPPSQVGLKSVQKAVEEIVPMSELRIGWQPYVPANVSLGSRRKGSRPVVHVLGCSQRRARLRNMQEEAVHRYDYVLPYFFDPAKQEEVIEETEVQVLAELDGMQAPLMCEFDYEMDDLDEFLDEKMEEVDELDSDKHRDPLKKAIQDAVKVAKDKYKAEKAERRKKLDAISPEEKEAIKNTKFIKFYPLNEWPDISKCKSPYINRYYGKATEVRDEYPDDDSDDA